MRLIYLLPLVWAVSTFSTECPNVLMIVIDDLNDWIGCMDGHPNAKTPNIDRLAVKGVVFDNAHCAAPLCGPSRAAVMSGLRPSNTGIYGHIHDEDMPDSAAGASVFLSNWFENNGYRTMGRGKIFHGSAPQGAFQELVGREKPAFGPRPETHFHWQQPRTNTDWGVFPDRDDMMPDFQTAEWAAKRLKAEYNEPFFMAVGFVRPHVPWFVPQKWFDLHPLDSIERPPYLPGDQDDVPAIARRIMEMPQMPTADWAIENGQWERIIQGYLACISFVDDCVGTVLDALEKSGHAENTVILLWSDHGYHIGEKNRFCKHSLWEEATRVPLIITAPGMKGERHSPRPVSLMDIYPTLLDLCSLPPNPMNEGVSLVPLLKNPMQTWNHPAITTYGENNHSVRTESFRYIRYEDGSEELYDLKQDSNEWNNLASNPEYDIVKNTLMKHLPETTTTRAPKSFNTCNDYFREKTDAGYTRTPKP